MALPKRLALAAALVALVATLGGCAAMNYPKYADNKKEVVTAREQSRQAIANGLAAAATAAGNTEAQRGQALQALLVLALTEKPDGLEAPREGSVERGVERLLDLAGLGLVVDRVGARVQGNSSQQSDRHDVAGSYNQDRHDSVVAGGD